MVTPNIQIIKKEGLSQKYMRCTTCWNNRESVQVCENLTKSGTKTETNKRKRERGRTVPKGTEGRRLEAFYSMRIMDDENSSNDMVILISATTMVWMRCMHPLCSKNEWLPWFQHNYIEVILGDTVYCMWMLEQMKC